MRDVRSRKIANQVRGAVGSIKPAVKCSGTPGKQPGIDLSPRSGRQPWGFALSTDLSIINHRLQSAIGRGAGSWPFSRKSLCGRPLRGLFSTLACILLVINVQAADVRAQQTSTADAGEKQLAITFDDLPLNGKQFELGRLRVMTDKLLTAIKREQVPVTGFVNESLLYVPGEIEGRIELLRQWRDAGVELGNHTFAHVGFKDTPIGQYEDDFVRGETITRALLKEKGRKPRYFRHPFLQMGPTLEQEQAFEKFIAERGYRTAPVTIDIFDWMFRVAYAQARTQGDAQRMKTIAAEYLKFANIKFDFCERVSIGLFGRPVKQILLLHANELNADNFDALAQLIKARGFHFITLEQALTDPVYQFPDRYKATSDWLNLWAYSKGQPFDPPAPPEFIQKFYADNPGAE
jgi:peptidoglycan/xylan/chitin deacetylase (PgdA/CDA1 family)